MTEAVDRPGERGPETVGPRTVGPESPRAEVGAPLATLQVPTRRIIQVGLALWVVALGVTLIVPSLHQGDRSWWPWACVSGLVLGGLGYAYVARGRGNAADAE